MGKVVKIVAAVVGVAALVIPGVGAAIGGTIFGTLAGAGVAVGTAATIANVALVSLIGIGVSGALQTVAGVLGLGPKPAKTSAATTDRLTATLNPREYRKSWVGHTAGNCDVRYQEYTGGNQEYLNSIIVAASHAVQSIDEIWFDDTMAWSATGGVASKYAGYLWVTTRTEGTAGNAFTITGSTSWVSSESRFAGCAYLWLRYKLTGNTSNAESPFSSSVPSRITIRGRGAKLYDPRQDSTVGGSGAQRANDQATWGWVSDDVGRNPALQLLWFLLGWRIQNPLTGAWKLAVGIGLPASRIDVPSFIAAANLCDEAVALAVGGTEPRYRADGVWSEGDDPSTVFGNLLASMNGVLRDAGGKLSLDILHNDLGTPIVDLGPADLVDAFTWLQSPPIDQSFTTVRGKYVDASNAGLYQLVDYPDVSIDSMDGIERSSTFDLSMVQSASQAQRLAKTYLQRAQYPGTFSADFLASAWRCQVGSVVRLTFPALAFENKLFRVIEHTIRQDGTCPMVLREEAGAIYSWDADERPAVVAAPAITYDPLNDPIVVGIGYVQASADEAYGAAHDAITKVAGLANDGIISINEKITKLIPESARLADKWASLSATAASLSVSSSAAASARASWLGMLAALAPAWNDITQDSPVVRATYDGARDAYGAALYDLAQAIDAKAATLAQWAGIGGWGKPQDNATRNVVTYATSDPGGVDGDLWVDISGTYAVFKLRLGGTWVVGANALNAYNALSGKPIALADINTTESSKLAGIAAGATVGAPAGTNVGGTAATTVESGANAANAGVNSDGTIKTDKVSTASVQTNAVTALGYVFSAGVGGGVSSDGYPSWSDVQSLTVSAIGVALQVGFAVNAIYAGDAGYIPTVDIRLLRNGSEIFSGPALYPSDYSADYRYFEVIDTPSAGTAIYKVQARAYHTHTDVGAAFTNRLLKAVELKK
ncbi:phage tail protein [Novosphingobium sp. EMRT-2]|uniref:phage tail protein n=1 Tax=Novosphingobium sp. EMRT-2 TaxID=2571749 RepID=UPI0010BD9112|nr:phage tail protein [Novosphingobium sp. EMRT-2]QCI92320.1 hypothetical protein FA702_01210 [Novosphingobium sp. EMRT-2]